MKYQGFKICLMSFIVIMIWLWGACDSRPETSEPIDSIEKQEIGSNEKQEVFMKFFFNPAPVVNYLVQDKPPEESAEDEDPVLIDKHTIFYSETFIEHPDSEIQSMEVTYFYDPNVIAPVNFLSLRFVPKIQWGDNFVTISASDFNLKPSDYSEVLTITWEALRTTVTDVTLRVDHLGLAKGKPILPKQNFTDRIQVLLSEARTSIQGPEYSIFEGEAFEALISLEAEQHRVCEFEFDIFFDSKRLVLDSSRDKPHEILLQDFNITTAYLEDRIHVKGWNDTGLSVLQADGKVDILKIAFIAEDSGLANISMDMNRMVSLDDVYLNPYTEALSQVITTNDGTPPIVFWFDPDELEVAKGDNFTTIIRVNTENYNPAAYGCSIKYDPDIFSLAEENPVEAGEHGYYMAYNPSEIDKSIIITGFSVTGMVELGDNLEFLIIRWKALAAIESTEIQMKFLVLADDGAIPIPNVKTSPAVIRVVE